MNKKKSGFTLLEIIAIIIVGGITAAALTPFISTALTRSHEPLDNLNHSLSFGSVMERIVAEHRKDGPESIEDLVTFQDRVDDFFTDNNGEEIFNTADLIINKLIRFQLDEESQSSIPVLLEEDCNGNDDCVLKVQLQRKGGGELITRLFAYKSEPEPDPDYNRALVSRGDIELAGSSEIHGDVRTVGGDVILGWSTKVDGDLITGSGANINRPNNVTGDIGQDDEDFPFCQYVPDITSICNCPFPYCDDFPAQWDDNIIKINDDNDNCYGSIIASGHDVNIEVGDEDRIILTNKINDGGSNHINIIAAPGTSGSGRLILYVKDLTSFLNSSSVNKNGDPSRLILYYAGNNDVVISGNAEFNGALFSPNAKVNILNSSVLNGYVEADSFYGGAAGGARLVSEYDESFKDYCGSIHPGEPGGDIAFEYTDETDHQDNRLAGFREGDSITDTEGGGVQIRVHGNQQYIILGHSQNNPHYGCIWYGGNLSACYNGVCDFQDGIRSYFRFEFDNRDRDPRSQRYGDGFTFTVANASNNNYSSMCGGDLTRGEYLAYSGPGPNDEGIKPPKIGIEFDVYPNTGCTYPYTNVGHRCDPQWDNHVAVVFWGDNVPDAGSRAKDNVHGVGLNPSVDSTTGFITDLNNSTTWMEDKEEYEVRIEIHRSNEISGNYIVKIWGPRIYTSASAWDDDMSVDMLEPEGASLFPFTRHEVDLSGIFDGDGAGDPSFHDMLDSVLFGWTYATGAARQRVTINNFRASFRR